MHKTRIAAMVIGLIALLGLATPSVASALPHSAPAVVEVAPAALPAGNGTSNFYLSGAVNVPYSWTSAIGVRMWATNWDYGANQQYHIGCSTSGYAYQIQQITIDGLNMGTSCDQIRTISGHASHYLKIVVKTWPGGTFLQGGFRL